MNPINRRQAVKTMLALGVASSPAIVKAATKDTKKSIYAIGKITLQEIDKHELGSRFFDVYEDGKKAFKLQLVDHRFFDVYEDGKKSFKLQLVDHWNNSGFYVWVFKDNVNPYMIPYSRIVLKRFEKRPLDSFSAIELQEIAVKSVLSVRKDEIKKDANKAISELIEKGIEFKIVPA